MDACMVATCLGKWDGMVTRRAHGMERLLVFLVFVVVARPAWVDGRGLAGLASASVSLRVLDPCFPPPSSPSCAVLAPDVCFNVYSVVHEFLSAPADSLASLFMLVVARALGHWLKAFGSPIRPNLRHL
jgi:hypothetical protein